MIDAHFAYPDGYAAGKLGQWFKLPVTVTLRGTEVPLAKIPGRTPLMLKALEMATKVFSVADSLKQHMLSLGADVNKIEVVGNGIDSDKFFPVKKISARNTLGIMDASPVIISVGGLVERKGFHRVIDVLPELIKKYPELIYLIVGGNSPEGGIRDKLESQVDKLGLEKHVRFLGAMPSEQLKTPLSAADVFVLATSNEGWANVFLEAMACGLPVVTTDVGGNSEVVVNDKLGSIVPFGESQALYGALKQALEKPWDSTYILHYARDNHWDKRVSKLLKNYRAIVKDW